VQVSEQDGVRFLHRGGDAIQSAMRIGAPLALDLEYTRCMLAFLLFQPQPAHLLMIGLGGGSLAKFVYHKLPQAHVTVVEIDRQVVTVARSHFQLPHDDARLRVRVADGAAFVARRRACADIVLLDGFEGGRQSPRLTTQAFYDAACRALRRHGLLVANFFGSDRHLRSYLDRIGASFGGRLACLRARGEGNIIVLAFKDDPGMIRREQLLARAAPLERKLGIDFSRYAAGLRSAQAILKIAR